jgi:hypothetical protein
MVAIEASPAELEALLSRQAASIDKDLTGPFKVLSVSGKGTEAVGCEVTAYRLVPVDPDNSALRDVFVPLPVPGRVELSKDGSVTASSFPQPEPAELREARMFARDLIEQGSVRGLSSQSRGPLQGRPTHEIQQDAAGRRIIRRIGYALR